MANNNANLFGNLGRGENALPGFANFASGLESSYSNLSRPRGAAASASARTPAPMPSNNVMTQLRRPSSFTPRKFTNSRRGTNNTGKPIVANNNVYRRQLNAHMLPIPLIEQMQPDAKAALANSLAAIDQKRAELATLASEIETRSVPLGKALQEKQELGALPVLNASFRGKNAPQVYVAQNPGTGELEVRGNFMESGYPFRVTNPNSFNAVLRNMKAKRRNASQKIPGLAKLTNIQKSFEKQYETKKAELDRLILKLQKDHIDFRRKSEVERARQAQQSLRTLSATRVPAGSSQLPQLSSLTTQASQALALPSAAPKATRTWGEFFRGKSKPSGGSRKRRGNRKTRKANRR